MSTTLEKQVEDLQTALDESTDKIEELQSDLSERPTTAEHEALQQELAEKQTELENNGVEAEVAQIKEIAETGKAALQYAREYTLGAYVSFSQCAEDSDEYVEYQAELRNDDDFLSIMRAGAGYYRRARNSRARGRQSSSEDHTPSNQTEKPKFIGRSSMGAVAS
jgi:predicted RNase H-like nuclease (RuvC/YqgF family)